MDSHTKHELDHTVLFECCCRKAMSIPLPAHWFLYMIQGYHGDTSAMFMVGKVSDKAQDLCKVTKHALDEAIKVCGPGVQIKEIGKVIDLSGELSF